MFRATISTLIFMLFAVPASADKRFTESDLSTLFSTTQVRNKIDALRNNNAYSSGAVQRVSPSSIKLNGIVKRSDGKSTVWLNGRSNIDQATVDGIKVPARQRRTDSVTVYVDGEIVKIKPGETWSDKKSDN